MNRDSKARNRFEHPTMTSILKSGDLPRAPAEGGEQEPGSPVNSAAAEPALLDPTAIASLRELDPTGKNQLLQRVLAAFQVSTARLLPQLVEAHRKGDAAGIRHVAHTLKSSSASVGGKSLSVLCADIEARIRHGNVDDLGAQVDLMCKEVEQLLRALEQLSAGRP